MQFIVCIRFGEHYRTTGCGRILPVCIAKCQRLLPAQLQPFALLLCSSKISNYTRYSKNNRWEQNGDFNWRIVSMWRH